MKRILFSFLAIGLLFSCKQEKRSCEGLYDKWTRCLHEAGTSIDELKERFQSKEAFVTKCKLEKDRNLMACMNKSSCGDFLFCADASKTKNRKLCQDFHEELNKCAQDLPREHEIHGFLEERERFVDDCEEKKYFSCKKKSSCGDKIFCLKTFGLQSKTENCGKLFDKMTRCFKEFDEDGKVSKGLLGEGKDKFVTECVKAEEAEKMLRCVSKDDSCNEFLKCSLGLDVEELKRLKATNSALPTGPKVNAIGEYDHDVQ